MVKSFLRSHILAVFGMLIPIPGNSQPGLEIASVEYNYYPGYKLENSGGEAFDVFTHIFRGTLRAPVFVSEKWQVLGSVQFKNFQTEQDEYAFLKNISGAATNFTAFRGGDKWNVFLTSEINYSSDKWSGFAFDDLIFRGGVGLLRPGIGNVEIFGAGIAASSDFGAATIVPIVFFRMKMNERLRFNATLPLQSRFSYRLKQNTILGVQQFVNYNAFIVSNDFRSEELHFGKIRKMTGGIFWEQKLYKNLWLTASGGALFRNVVFLYDKNRHETDKLVGGMNYFVNLKLSVKMNKNEGNFN